MMSFAQRPPRSIVIILVSSVLSFFILQRWTSYKPSYLYHAAASRYSQQDSQVPSDPVLGKVWQIFLDPPDHDPEIKHMDAIKASHIPFELTGSWLPVDGGWDYHFMGTDRADDFVRAKFKDYPKVVDVFTNLKRPVVRGDFMRYLAVCAEGGVFSDYDTMLKKPLQKWIPAQYKDQTRAVIGVEYDKLDQPRPKTKSFDVSFAQYTFAAAPWHPIMMNMVLNLTDSLLIRAAEQGQSIAELDFNDREVLKISGPKAFTDIIYQHMRDFTREDITWKDVSMLDEPKLIGDTLILTINGFGAGQGHSRSNDSSPDVLVRHMFNGGWRGGKDKLSGHKKEKPQ